MKLKVKYEPLTVYCPHCLESDAFVWLIAWGTDSVTKCDLCGKRYNVKLTITEFSIEGKT